MDERSMMPKVEIERTSTDDVAELQHIGRETFFETFSSGNTEENMNEYLNTEFAVEKLQDELTDENSEFYFARVENKVVGYLKVNIGKSQTDIKDQNALEIERIYVLKEFHGKEVGKLLYAKAIEIAKQKRVDYVWLGVWEQNPRAIRFYEKNGFVAFDKHIFKLGDDEQTDIMMKMQLTNDNTMPFP